MDEPNWSGPLAEAYEQATRYLSATPDRRMGTDAAPAQLRQSLGGPLPAAESDPREVIAALAAAVEPGLLATTSGRFFGFVVGGSMPVALAADWLTSVWDQNAGLQVLGPAATIVEEVAGDWMKELFGLPGHASVGYVTGTQMANLTGLAAARHHVLRRVGWDVEVDGLIGAPPLRVLAGADRHATIDRAVRFLGLGSAAVVPVAVDGDGRMRPDALRAALSEQPGPVIVCTQVGHINTGAIDPVGEICAAAREAQAWVHVDGAFGLWAAASPRLRPMLAGVGMADSWATDAHKWLNVPYDSGVIFCAHPDAHRAAMGVRASYLMHGRADERDPLDYNPEFSRRARGFTVYATLRALGRSGLQRLVERSCDLAQRFADRLAREANVEVLNDVVLNQVLVRFLAPDGGDDDRHTNEVISRVQADGTCWMSGTTWRGHAAMRISVTNWTTDEADVDRSVQVILRCASSATGLPRPA